jgi:hypothetical protein
MSASEPAAAPTAQQVQQNHDALAAIGGVLICVGIDRMTKSNNG